MSLEPEMVSKRHDNRGDVWIEMIYKERNELAFEIGEMERKGVEIKEEMTARYHELCREARDSNKRAHDGLQLGLSGRNGFSKEV